MHVFAMCWYCIMKTEKGKLVYKICFALIQVCDINSQE